ncbi:MAG: ATPase domain-containing protein [Candidatus Micrarchaeota archaeon]
MVNRVKTGIPGMDELIEGGFPESSSILVSGSAGCGKSIFCLEYLYNGGKLFNEPGVYVTLEEHPNNLWWMSQRFKWDLLSLERENLLKVYKFDPTPDSRNNIEAQTKKIVDKARQLNAKRLVIDSITAFSFWVDDLSKIRYTIYSLIEELREINCTTLLTVESAPGRDSISRFGVEEFLVDGIVQLHFRPPHRSLFVRKMRGTKHDVRVHPLEINDDGISVDSKSEILWEALKD